jgi:hypothetical protein
MIRTVILRRFKKFANQEFNLEGPVVLAGTNNCGKTTVLQAIAAWRLAIDHWRLVNDYQKHRGGFTQAPIARQAFSAVPLLTFDQLWNERNYNGAIEIEVALSNSNNDKVVVELTADSTEQIYVRPRKDVTREMLDRANFDTVYVSSIAGLSTVEPVYGDQEYVRTLLGSMRPGEVIRNLLWQLREMHAWEELANSVKKLFNVEILRPRNVGGRLFSEYRNFNGQTFDITTAGSGFQQVLLLLAVLHTRKEGSVLLVDEPDAHLHVFLQDTIFSELQITAAARKSQLILATHSEVIFNSVPPEQLLVMMGPPRRLNEKTQRDRLRQAMMVLQQSDIVAATETSGVLYLEGITDLNLLRAWAERLQHRALAWLDRSPLWKPITAPPHDGGASGDPRKNFDLLQLVNDQLTGVHLIDSDGKKKGIPPTAIVRGRLNRIVWSRYESESYLVHPAALVRFIENRVPGSNGMVAVRSFFEEQFGHELAEEFIANPLQPKELIENYLRAKKAREEIIPPILTRGGILGGFDYTRFFEIASLMTAEEIHPEVIAKLDAIADAFSL